MEAPKAPEPPRDPALAREPAPPKHVEKRSQAASWEHQAKLKRLPRLRAPFSPGRPRGGR